LIDKNMAGLEAGLDYVAQQAVRIDSKKLQELTLFF